MADGNKGSRRKKRRAPAPPQPTVDKDTSVVNMTGKDELGDCPVKDFPVEVEDKNREVPDLNGGMGQTERENPEEITPFAGDSAINANLSNTAGKNSIACDIIAETDTSNAEKKEDSERQEKKTPANYPKGLSPFSDESDTDAVDTSINPQLPNSSEVGKPTPTPQPPPRRFKRKARKPKKDSGCTRCTEHKSAKGVGVYHSKSAKGSSTVSKHSPPSKDDREAGNGNTKSGKSVSETAEDSQNDQQATIGGAGICKSAECYPKHLNPFGEDSDTGDEVNSAKETTQSIAAVKSVDESYPEHLNPFGEDSDSEDEDHHEEETDGQSVSKDAVTANQKGGRIKVDDYPEELNPFSEDIADEIISPRVIFDDESINPRFRQAISSSDQEAAINEKKLGRVKRVLKSLRRLIGRLATCTRPQAESGI